METTAQHISSLLYFTAIFVVLCFAALIRVLRKSFEHRKTLQHLKHNGNFDEEDKKAFKQKIRYCYMVEEHRNREKLRRQITKAIMIAQTYQFQRLRHSDITKIIRRTLLNFRYRFFTNLRMALIKKSRKQKGGTGHLTHMQQDAIREMMFAMGLKNLNKPPKTLPPSSEDEAQWLAQESRIKVMEAALERKNLNKPPEIRKAAVRAGYYADDSLKRKRNNH